MSRRRVAIGFLVVVVLAAAGGWLAGRRVSSPAEVAARTAPPEPSPIFVPAEARVLSTDVVTRGTGRFGTRRQVWLATSHIGAADKVVTALPGLGTEANEGDVLLRTSGRPLIVMEGTIPAFRDLGPGVVGEDVSQLEAALQRLGYEPGPVDGRYDEQTEAAVVALYTALDHEPAVVGADQVSELFPPGAYASEVPSAGVLLAADEIFFTPSLPVRVAEIATPVGQAVDGPILTVTDANVAIDGSLPVTHAGLVTPGMSVLIDEPDLGITASGVVTRIADSPGTDGVDGFHLYFEVGVDEAPPSLINASVRLTIAIESTAGEVLVVPLTALSLRGDGASVVQVDRRASTDGDVALETVEVRPGLAAKGLVEVAPIDGQLDPGDLVLVGFDNPGVVADSATTDQPTDGAESGPSDGSTTATSSG